jgi:hypothetical protein
MLNRGAINCMGADLLSLFPNQASLLHSSIVICDRPLNHAMALTSWQYHILGLKI